MVVDTNRATTHTNKRTLTNNSSPLSMNVDDDAAAATMIMHDHGTSRVKCRSISSSSSSSSSSSFSVDKHDTDANADADAHAHADADAAITTTSNHSRRKMRDEPWSKAEHDTFMAGYDKWGHGNWKQIMDEFVPTRNNKQICAYAMKRFVKNKKQKTKITAKRKKNSKRRVDPSSSSSSSSPTKQKQKQKIRTEVDTRSKKKSVVNHRTHTPDPKSKHLLDKYIGKRIAWEFQILQDDGIETTEIYFGTISNRITRNELSNGGSGVSFAFYIVFVESTPCIYVSIYRCLSSLSPFSSSHTPSLIYSFIYLFLILS